MKTFIEKYTDELHLILACYSESDIKNFVEKISKKAYNKGIADATEKVVAYNAVCEEEEYAKIEIIESIKSLEIK